jgi:hypothetical protein
MLTTVEAVVEKDGAVRLKEPLHLDHSCRAFVTILEEAEQPDAALLSEAALAQDWNRTEEDAAWSHLQSEP